jgi:hypothetical protein
MLEDINKVELDDVETLLNLMIELAELLLANTNYVDQINFHTKILEAIKSKKEEYDKYSNY